MRQIRAFLLRLGGWFQQSRQEQDLTDELESNLAFHMEDNMRAGMPPEEARRHAILSLGGIERTKQDCRDRLGLPLLETFLYDLRYGARSLGKSRIFTAIAVATLALGIGASTTMFTVAQAVLWRPLPYAEPNRLVAISEVDRLKPSTGANVASADFADWQRMNTVFSGMASYVGIDERGKARIDLHLTGIGETRVLKGLVVNRNLFDVLGVAPMLGRGFAGDDHVAILSYRCWQDQFSADPHIVGRSITLGGKPTDIIGPGHSAPPRYVSEKLVRDDIDSALTGTFDGRSLRLPPPSSSPGTEPSVASSSIRAAPRERTPLRAATLLFESETGSDENRLSQAVRSESSNTRNSRSDCSATGMFDVDHAMRP